MTKIISYYGSEPTLATSPTATAAIALLNRQLDILEKTLEQVWLVAEGTRLSETELPSKKTRDRYDCIICHKDVNGSKDKIHMTDQGYAHETCLRTNMNLKDDAP